MEGTLGEITLFAGDFAPKNWAFCNGQLLQIHLNQPLFAVLGINYGGDGITTFRLPDLRGRVAIGSGQLTINNETTTFVQGKSGGNAGTVLKPENIPIHDHRIIASVRTGDGKATGEDPTGTYVAETIPQPPNAYNLYSPYLVNTTWMANGFVVGTTGSTGLGVPFPVMQPFLGINYIICLIGLFPSRG